MPDDRFDWGDYQLLDSGDGAKLERFGDYILDRPSPQALWSKQLPELWQEAHARFTRDSSGGGNWSGRDRLPDTWTISAGGQRMLLKPTGFGHIGLFAEQIPFWNWIRRRCEATTTPRVLNLFGYTGGSSLAAAAGGADVTHCDSSKGVVSWGRENQNLSGLDDRNIRWIVDDARKYVKREARRESHYDGIILDPPSFGRGSKGEVWKLEQDLSEHLADCVALLRPDAGFVLLSAHSPGVGAVALERLLREAVGSARGDWAHGEMAISETTQGLALPSGCWASFSAGHPCPSPRPWEG
jgi:23S rRNA (cytosine1962-C5)-methyltransferase